MFTIIFLVIVWRCEEWRPLRPLAVAALLLVILQGVLGGLRVEINERYLALVHGSVGPLFFAFTAALAVLTKPTLQSAKGRFRIGLTAIPLLLFCQLVFGATLRHTPEEGSPWAFGLHVQSHLAMAAVVVVSLWITAIHAKPRGVPLRLAWAMALLVLAQVGLGIATWYSKYGLPDWAESLAAGTMHASTAGGWTETNTVTAHSAVGAMLLALAVARATWIVSRPQDEEEEEEEERGSSQE